MGSDVYIFMFYVIFFVLRIRQMQKIPKLPEMDLCVHFYVPRKILCFMYTPNKIWKILKSPEIDFDVYIFTFCVNFYVSRIRQT